MLLYYIILVIVVVVLYMFVDVRSEPSAASQIFQHSLECSLECSLMLLMQRSVHGLLSISLFDA